MMQHTIITLQLLAVAGIILFNFRIIPRARPFKSLDY